MEVLLTPELLNCVYGQVLCSQSSGRPTLSSSHRVLGPTGVPFSIAVTSEMRHRAVKARAVD